jgi:hypothetical protein
MHFGCVSGFSGLCHTIFGWSFFLGRGAYQWSSFLRRHLGCFGHFVLMCSSLVFLFHINSTSSFLLTFFGGFQQNNYASMWKHHGSRIMGSSMLEEHIYVNWMEYDIKVQLNTFMTYLEVFNTWYQLSHNLCLKHFLCWYPHFPNMLCNTMFSFFITIIISFVKYATIFSRPFSKVSSSTTNILWWYRHFIYGRLCLICFFRESDFDDFVFVI